MLLEFFEESKLRILSTIWLQQKTLFFKTNRCRDIAVGHFHRSTDNLDVSLQTICSDNICRANCFDANSGYSTKKTWSSFDCCQAKMNTRVKTKNVWLTEILHVEIGISRYRAYTGSNQRLVFVMEIKLCCLWVSSLIRNDSNRH